MRKLILLLSLFLGIAITSSIEAQPPPPGGGPGGPGGGGQPPCFPPPCVPIDGGLSWLLLAGTLYGGKKAYDFSKKEDI